MKTTSYESAHLPEWSPLAFSPFVHDPVGQLLRRMHRGQLRTPFWRKLFTARELWEHIERDPVVWEDLEGLLVTMRAEWSTELRARRGELAPDMPPKDKRFHGGSAMMWQNGGVDPETGDRHYLRIPETQVMGTRLVAKILDAGVGFPRVAKRIISGRMYPIYLMADAQELLERAHEIRYEKRIGRGRPKSLWTIAYELDKESAH